LLTSQHDDAQVHCPKILPILKIVVGRQERFKAGLHGEAKQLAVPGAGPSLLLNGPNLVPYEVRRQLAWQLLIEKNGSL